MKWSVGDMAKKRALLTPDKTALIFEDEGFTFRKINEEVNRTAHFLQRTGLRKGDRCGSSELS